MTRMQRSQPIRASADAPVDLTAVTADASGDGVDLQMEIVAQAIGNTCDGAR